MHDGYVLQKSVCKLPVGGQLLNTLMQKVRCINPETFQNCFGREMCKPHSECHQDLHMAAHLQALEGRGTSLRPRYAIKRVERLPGEFSVSASMQAKVATNKTLCLYCVLNNHLSYVAAGGVPAPTQYYPVLPQLPGRPHQVMNSRLADVSMFHVPMFPYHARWLYAVMNN